MSKTIVAIGAHTGDAQLTMGMLLAKHALQGDRVVTVDLTAGERGAPKGVPTHDFRAVNVEGARLFAEKIGGESIVLETPDGELVHTPEAALALSDLLRELKADAVLCHFYNSLHLDHITAHHLTQQAVFWASLPTFTRPLPATPIRRTLMAENWEDADGFVPYHFFDVTDAFPLWKEAIVNLYLAEHSASFPYLRYYDALSITRGALIGKDRATAFAVQAWAKRVVE